jgi:hypothetical protein
MAFYAKDIQQLDLKTIKGMESITQARTISGKGREPQQVRSVHRQYVDGESGLDVHCNLY